MGRETGLEPTICLHMISAYDENRSAEELTSAMAERGLSWYWGSDVILVDYYYIQRNLSVRGNIEMPFRSTGDSPTRPRLDNKAEMREMLLRVIHVKS
jgi:hypothetical protein